MSYMYISLINMIIINAFFTNINHQIILFFYINVTLPRGTRGTRATNGNAM